MNIFLVALLILITATFKENLYFSLSLMPIFILLTIMNRKQIDAKRIVIVIVIFLAFFLRLEQFKNDNISKLTNGEFTGKIEVAKNININGDYLRAEGSINGESIILDYKLNSEKEKNYFINNFSGGTLYVIAEINDIKEKKNYYSFDYKQYSKNLGMFKTVSITKINNIENNKFQSYYNKLVNLRTKSIKNINSNISFNKSGIFEALVYGDKSYMFKEDLGNYNKLGIGHLLAISGLHVAALIGIVYKILQFFSLSINTIHKIIYVILPFYVFLTGGQPSVVRAVMMVIIFLICRKFNFNNLDSLLITFILLIFINPNYIYYLGFQYSFFVTFCIIMSVPYISSSRNKIESLFRISLVSFLAGLPISLYNFHEINILSIFSNIIFVPLFTVFIFPFVSLSYVIYLISTPVFNFLCKPILNFIFQIFDYLQELLVHISIEIKIPAYNYIISILILIIVLICLIMLNKNNIKMIAISFIILILSVNIPKILPRVVLETISIANNEVLFIRDNDKTILVNTSNNYQDYYTDFRKKEQKYDIINEYEKLFAYEGMKEIEYLILTRPESRNIGFASTLIGKGLVKKLLICTDISDNKRVQEIENLARFKNIKIDYLETNRSYTVGKVTIVNAENSFSVQLLEKKTTISKG